MDFLPHSILTGAWWDAGSPTLPTGGALPSVGIAARRQSLVTHIVFGFGLYAAAWLQSTLWRI